MTDPLPSVEDDELLHRRVPIRTGWFDPVANILRQDAFRPSERDADGLSISRAHSAKHPEFLTPEQCARVGPSTHGYYVAVLRASDVRSLGIEIVPDPVAQDPGHCLLLSLNAKCRKEPRIIEICQLLAAVHTLRVEGPFPQDVGGAVSIS